MRQWLQTEWDVAAWSESTIEHAIRGSAEECVEQLRAHVASGVDRIILIPVPLPARAGRDHRQGDPAPPEGRREDVTDRISCWRQGDHDERAAALLRASCPRTSCPSRPICRSTSRPTGAHLRWLADTRGVTGIVANGHASEVSSLDPRGAPALAGHRPRRGRRPVPGDRRRLLRRHRRGGRAGARREGGRRGRHPALPAHAVHVGRPAQARHGRPPLLARSPRAPTCRSSSSSIRRPRASATRRRRWRGWPRFPRWRA